MKQKETEFLKALGGIPQSYIDELTQFHAEHAQAPGQTRRNPKQRSDEPRKENFIMINSTQHSAEKSRENEISVRKLRPITIGIFASLAACAVVAVGLGAGLFKKNDLNMPAASLEQSDSEVTESAEESILSEEAESVQPEESVTEDPAANEEPALSAEDRVYDIYSCYGDNSETGGLPDIPEDSAMLFTSLDDLRPMLERAVNSDFPAKGLQAAESCFENGRNILIIKTKWMLDSYDSMIRSLYLTADNYLHADIASCRSDVFDPGLDPNRVTHFYMVLSVPGSLQSISGATVQQSLFELGQTDTSGCNEFKDEMIAYFEEGVYLKHLSKNDADYIFPELTFEMYTPEKMDDSSAWMLGSMMVNMEDSVLPENIMSDITEIVDPNLTQLNENTLIGINNVESGASPYISVYDNLSAPERRLVYPEQKYDKVFASGMRVTLLCSSALSGSAEMQAPLEEPVDADPILPHSEGHASRLLIVNDPSTDYIPAETE